MPPVEHVLPADAEVEEAVEKPRRAEPEVVQHDFVREVVRTALALHSVLDKMFAELVREARVERELLVVELSPHARAEADVVDVLPVRARHHRARCAGKPRHVVHDLLAYAEVRSGRDRQSGVYRLVGDWNLVCFGHRGQCDGIDTCCKNEFHVHQYTTFALP